MKRCFITLKGFMDDWEKEGLTEEDMGQLEQYLCADPQIGKVVKGTHGIRKMRYKLPFQGKSGSLRVFYLDIPDVSKTYLLTLLSKTEKENLSKSEINELASLSLKLKGIAK